MSPDLFCFTGSCESFAIKQTEFTQVFNRGRGFQKLDIKLDIGRGQKSGQG